MAREDTPYSAPTSDVTLTAVAPHTWARLGGRVVGRECDGTTHGLPGATVAVDRGKQSWTLTTASDGSYALWIPGSKRSARVVAADADAVRRPLTWCSVREVG